MHNFNQNHTTDLDLKATFCPVLYQRVVKKSRNPFTWTKYFKYITYVQPLFYTN